MKTNASIITIITTLFFIQILCIPALTIASPSPQNRNNFPDLLQPNGNDRDTYTGRVRVYIVEPVSRWKMQSQQPYHFGLLKIPLNDEVSIPLQETYEKTIIWDASAAGFPDVSKNNIMVMTALFNTEPHQGYAYPPSGNPFDAYYVDAAAGATPGNISYNFRNKTFSHTVFIEEGTATWCQYCPAMANALNRVYESKVYPFYFAALIDDKSPDAAPRLRNEYNIAGFPTAFFDGGFKVLVGGDSNDNSYKTRIRQCSQREVPNLNVSIAVDWLGGGDLSIHVRIQNEGDNNPSNLVIGTISGGTHVSTTLQNNNTIPVSNVQWNISVVGGMLGFINSYTNGTIGSLALGQEEPVQTTTPVFGFGKVTITIMAKANEVPSSQKIIPGFVIGPFILLQ